jgi:Fe-S-cluster-containing hydrogenase component 2
MVKGSVQVDKETLINVPESGVVVCDEDLCTGCGTCELMCSLYHEGVIGREFSRLEVVEFHFSDRMEFRICNQCPYPSCYFACPLRDTALCIDDDTGARYIDGEECTGCRECMDACPLDPPRIKLNVKNDVAFKCDLCKDRADGPICVDYCNHGALKFVSGR